MQRNGLPINRTRCFPATQNSVVTIPLGLIIDMTPNLDSIQTGLMDLSMPKRFDDCHRADTARWRCRFRLLAYALILLAISPVVSSLSANETESGSGSRQYLNQAVASIPFQQLNQQTREKVMAVVERPSIYRRLPVTTIQADPDYFQYLTRYPEVVVNIWQLMGVTQMTTERTGPFTLDTDDGSGTISKIDLVYGNENLHIFHGTGSYEGPMIRRRLTGSCVLILQTKYTADKFGRPQAINQLDVFVKIDNAAVGLVAKTIAPLVGSTADANFLESIKFVERLNETTESNGPGVQQMATRFQVDDDVRNGFIEVAGQVFERSTIKDRGFSNPPSVAKPIGSRPISVEPTQNQLPVTTPYSIRTPTNSLQTNPPSPPPSITPDVNRQGNLVPHSSRGDNSETNRKGSATIDASGYRAAARPAGYEAPDYNSHGGMTRVPWTHQR